MSDSILTSTKKVLGLEDEYTPFDVNVLMYINSTFSKLNQLGIGPENGFAIVDKSTTWDAFIGTDARFNLVQTYVYLSVRLLFDPPQTSYLIEAIKEQMKEHEWRLVALSDSINWTPPVVTGSFSNVLDGGEA